MFDINNVKTITVVGAGTMGHEIAQVALMGGFSTVVLHDLTDDILTEAAKKITKNLENLNLKGKFDPKYTNPNLIQNLIKETDLEKAVSHTDFVIEAIPEIMSLKKDLFKRLGILSPEHAILATNTSTMSVTEIASSSGKPDKVIGCHFFTPIVVLRLIEIIRGIETSDSTVNITEEVCKKFPAIQGKRFLPLLHKERPGFIVNRVMLSISLYLQWLLDFSIKNGIPLEEIDADADPIAEIGPFAKLDYLGLDVIYNTMKYFAEVLSPEFSPGKTLTRLVKKGNLGRKSGKGLFEWKQGKPIISKEKKAGLFNIELFMAIQLNEGCKLLEEGVVKGYKTIDDTIMAGMNLPGPFGPGKRNYNKWIGLLEDFVEESGITYVKPCNLLKTGKFLQMRR
ncbi:MAG: 3-hydroxyacyl-CoA dehydrogenase NAD-binding domain-containing protein [Promethearchaeota archaeon]|jgi:enoyl-CoA hydratase/3-hydroxyacyl-CoA dehydrogenase